MDRLSGFDARTFLRDHWQQRPCVLRQALPAFASPISGDELAGLACQAEVESRIVRGPDKQDDYRLSHGPFETESFAQLLPQDWTLLVQHVDYWHPPVAALLTPFQQFIPSWRIDDIMVSFAVAGGSVGPHYDHYDVFLLQGQGRRRWRIDSRADPDLSYRPDHPLRLLKHFDPDQEWVLEPGDILYLPPHVPHHGTALDEGITLSIGLRAPSHRDLLLSFCQHQVERLSDFDRYRDPNPQWGSLDGELSPELVDQFSQLLQQMTAAPSQPLGSWLGCLLSQSPYPIDHHVDNDLSVDQLRQAQGLQRQAATRCLYQRQGGQQAELYLAGQVYRCRLSTAQQLCRQPRLDTPSLATLLDDDADLMLHLCRSGHWTVLS